MSAFRKCETEGCNAKLMLKSPHTQCGRCRPRPHVAGKKTAEQSRRYSAADRRRKMIAGIAWEGV